MAEQKVIKAKPHQALRDLAALIKGSEIDDTVKVRGFVFQLRTMNFDDESWADRFVAIGLNVQVVKHRWAAYVAAAIKTVIPPGGSEPLTKEKLFPIPEEMETETRVLLESNPIEKHYWLNQQMLYFLSEDGNSELVGPLWFKLSEMIGRRRKAYEEAPDFSERTLSGSVAPTSLPEKESSSPIQASA